MKDFFHRIRLTPACGVLALLSLSFFSARANISVSDITLNGSSHQTATALGNGVIIGYILSDTADRGVAINIYSNASIIRTFSVPTNALATNGAGLSRGTNAVFWDGEDANSNAVGFAAFSVSVSASSSGHATWTVLTTNSIHASPSSGGYYAYAPRGIAVDEIPTSPYYGRVFVANAATGPAPNTVAGDNDAILKFNADGSAADDGAFGYGGYPMQDANFSLPQKLRTSDDNRLYMNDYSAGNVVAFDEALAQNQIVLSSFNYFANPFFAISGNGSGWFGMDVTAASATNGLIWQSDYGSGGSGVWFWHLIGGAADTNDNTGTWSIAAGPGASLSVDASGGFMADTNDDVFAAQYIDGPTNAAFRCMMFTNASGVSIETNAFWAVGAGDDSFQDVYDTTIDSRLQPHYVACAMSGPSASGVRVLNAADGSTVVANLDPTNTYYASAWDHVGNLYAISDSLHGWRVWSPPGAGNTDTTVGHVTITTVSALTILSVAKMTNHILVSFTASSTNAPSNFSLLTASNVAGPYVTNTSASITNGSEPGAFTAVAPTNGPTQFYLIKD